jgi:hypothetical protein
VRKTGRLHIALLALFLVFARANAYSETNTSFLVATTEATAITSNSAELHGVVNTAGSETGVWFEWGTSNTLGSRSDVKTIAPGTAPVSFALSIKELQPHTTYYFRAVAYRSATTMAGDIRQFTTSGDATTPTNTKLEVTTAAPTSVTANSATLHGSINPGGVSAMVWFNWGKTSSLGTRTDARSVSGTTAVMLEQALKNLEPHTTYYFRVEAYSSSGGASATGETKTFATGDAPAASLTIRTNDATRIEPATAVLNATVLGATGKFGAWFEWGKTESLGSKTDAQVFGEGREIQVAQQLKDLQPRTKYYFRAVLYPGVEGAANVLGQIKTFTTSGEATTDRVPATAPEKINEVEQGQIRSGYVVITPDSGSAAPAATVTFGMVREGSVVSQAGIIPTPTMTDGAMFVEIIPSISRSIGVAFANPGSDVNPITLTLRDDDGLVLGSPVVVSVPAHQQVSKFLTELFGGNAIGRGFRGSVRMQSATAFAAIGLRFSGQVFSTLPIAITTAVAGAQGAVVIPQFAIAGGWATQIALVNNTNSAIAGRVDVFDSAGNPLPVKLNGETRSSFTYSIPVGGTFVLAPRDSNGQSPL